MRSQMEMEVCRVPMETQWTVSVKITGQSLTPLSHTGTPMKNIIVLRLDQNALKGDILGLCSALVP